MAVKEIISFGIKGTIAKRMISLKSKKLAVNINNKIDKAIETVGLLQLKNKRLGELSGREQERVLITKAVVNDHKLLIFYGPKTIGIDNYTRNKFYVLLQKLDKDNKLSIIWLSYDLGSISKYVNKVTCINRKVFFHGDIQNFSKMMAFPRTFSQEINTIKMGNHISNRMIISFQLHIVELMMNKMVMWLLPFLYNHHNMIMIKERIKYRHGIV